MQKALPWLIPTFIISTIAIYFCSGWAILLILMVGLPAGLFVGRQLYKIDAMRKMYVLKIIGLGITEFLIALLAFAIVNHSNELKFCADTCTTLSFSEVLPQVATMYLLASGVINFAIVLGATQKINIGKFLRGQR